MAETRRAVTRPVQALFAFAGGWALLLIVTVMAIPATATATGERERQLRLHAKDPATWQIRPNGGQGTMIYNEQTGRLTLVAQRLKPHSSYLLVRYAGAPPTADLLTQGMTNAAGQLHLDGKWHNWTGKFWLLPAADAVVAGNRATLAAWHPEQYLFEEKVLGIPCECAED